MRRYREDAHRIVKLQSGLWVRRPQAEPSRTDIDWADLIASVVVWFLCLIALFYALPILLEGLTNVQ